MWCVYFSISISSVAFSCSYAVGLTHCCDISVFWFCLLIHLFIKGYTTVCELFTHIYEHIFFNFALLLTKLCRHACDASNDMI